MNKFIKLNKYVININKISKIEIQKDLYKIFFNNRYHEGVSFLGFGSLNTYEKIISICKEKNPECYNIINKWISNIKNE